MRQSSSPRPSAAENGSTVRVRTSVGAADTRSRRRRLVTWLLLGGAGMLLVNAIVGENGYFATLQAKRTEAALMHAVARVRVENRQLQDERERLESDPAAIEQTIRERLGYIRPGEVAIIVRDIPEMPADPPR